MHLSTPATKSCQYLMTGGGEIEIVKQIAVWNRYQKQKQDVDPICRFSVRRI